MLLTDRTPKNNGTQEAILKMSPISYLHKRKGNGLPTLCARGDFDVFVYVLQRPQGVGRANVNISTCTSEFTVPLFKSKVQIRP